MAVTTTAVIIAAAGLALSAYGTYKGMQAQKKQAKAAKEERAVRFRRERREQIRRAQIAQAQIENSGAVVGGSVGNVAGGARSVQSQAGANIGFMSTVNSLQNEQSRQAGRASNFGMLAGIGNSLFSIGTGMMGAPSQSPTKAPTPQSTSAVNSSFYSAPINNSGAF